MKTRKIVRGGKKRTSVAGGAASRVPAVPPTDPSLSQQALVHQAPQLALAPSRAAHECKLDLGCGQSPKEGYEGVDLYGSEAKHHVDLFKFPWPFSDESVDEVHCSHFLEHVPAREVEVRDLIFRPGTTSEEQGRLMEEFVGKDMLFAFMDECYRVMKPAAWMHVVVPSGRSNRAFWDPTHRRFFMQETFGYFWDPWRKANKLDHYRVKCNFMSNVNYSLPGEEMLRAPEVHNERFHHMWNVTHDWLAELQKMPPGVVVPPAVVPLPPPVVAGQ